MAAIQSDYFVWGVGKTIVDRDIDVVFRVIEGPVVPCPAHEMYVHVLHVQWQTKTGFRLARQSIV